MPDASSDITQQSAIAAQFHEGSTDLAELNRLKQEKAKLDLFNRIEKDFTYHTPKLGQPEQYQIIRDTAKKLARVMVENCPAGRELSTALTSLETAVFHANAAIARS